MCLEILSIELLTKCIYELYSLLCVCVYSALCVYMKSALCICLCVVEVSCPYQYDVLYSGFSIIRLAVCQYNLNTALISELVWISEQAIKSYFITKLQTRPIKDRYYA